MTPEEPDGPDRESRAGAADARQAAASAALLPEPVRRRVAGLTVGVIGGLKPNQVPADLRMATRWQSGRVPRGFVDKVLGSLADDEGWRQRVGAILADERGLGGPMAEAQADPVETAALAYLIRPEGWRDAVADAVQRPAQTGPGQQDPGPAATQLAELQARLERERQRRERDVAAAKRQGAAEQARLAARVERLRAQVESLQQELDAAKAARDEYRQEAVDLDRAVRRLRTDSEQSAARAAQRKAAQREGRLASSARAKVLLEVLARSVAGLADELAIAPATADPADLVDAVGPSQPVRQQRINTVGELSQELTLPRCHLIVDGYNLTKGLWPNRSLQQQRDALIRGLEPLAARTGAEVTVVFDGAQAGPVPAAPARAVRVRFSPPGEPADRVIVRLVDAEPAGRPVVVVSSDGALASGARNAGAATAGREVLAQMLGLGSK